MIKLIGFTDEGLYLETENTDDIIQENLEEDSQLVFDFMKKK